MRKIRACVHGFKNLEVSDLPDHHACRLGEWYDKADSDFSSLRSFQEIASPHQRLHELGKSIVTVNKSGNAKEAERLFSELEQVSQRVAGLLEKAKQDAAAKV